MAPAVNIAVVIRDLRPTDIRCHECDAAPGDSCRDEGGPMWLAVHQSRADEHRDLVEAGWKWQTPIHLDAGAERNR